MDPLAAIPGILSRRLMLGVRLRPDARWAPAWPAFARRSGLARPSLRFPRFRSGSLGKDPEAYGRGTGHRARSACATPDSVHPSPPAGCRFAPFILFMTLGFSSPVSAAQIVDHSGWDRLLHRYVKEGRVDYQGLTAERSVLEQYLASLANINTAQLSLRQEQLAFWINAYNACGVKGVLDHYPVQSVKDIKGFFEKTRYAVAGDLLTLNEIEGRGRALGDWRIHFALVCASTSCPPLRSEAYLPKRLNAQLQEQTRQFLRDEQWGLRLAPREETLWVSKIFKWYAKDFVPDGRLSAQGLLELLRPDVEPALAQAISHELLKDYVLHVRFLDYDWTLNSQARSSTGGGG